MNIPVGLTPEQTRAFLQRQANTGRYLILGTVIITVINLLCLLVNSDFYITYSLAAGYYAAWLGKLMDHQYISVLGPNGASTATGLVIAGVLLAGLLVLWILAKKNVRWIRVAIGVLVADSLVLVALAALVFQGDLLSVVWELVIHVAVIWEMSKAVSARKMLEALPEREAGN